MPLKTEKINVNLHPHENRGKVFPNEHEPITDPISLLSIVATLKSKRKADILKIFEESLKDFRANNIILCSDLQDLFRSNILFLCMFYGISQRQLFKEINSKGVKVSRQAFANRIRKKHYSLLYVAMFSRIFGIEVGVLVGVDLRKLI